MRSKQTGKITPSDINRIKDGIIIEERELSVIDLNVKNLPDKDCLVIIKIAEGRKKDSKACFFKTRVQGFGFKENTDRELCPGEH